MVAVLRVNNTASPRTCAPGSTVSRLNFARLPDVGRGLWLTLIVLVLITLATGAMVIWHLRQFALANSEREVNNLGIVLAEQTSRTIQSVDLILREVQERTSSSDRDPSEQPLARLAGDDSHRFLASHLLNLPQAEAICLVDASGMLVNWSRDEAVPAVDFSDREYFRQMKSQDESEAFISAPAEGRITGKWLMFITRRLNNPDGSFLGLVIALIDSQYLEEFYRTIGMVPGEAVTVLRRDGVVVAGYPDIEDRRGMHVPTQSPWYGLLAEGGGAYRSPGFLSHVPLIVTVHPLRDYALVLNASISEEAALNDWRNQSTGIAAVTICTAFGLTALFWLIAIQFQRQRVIATALRESEMQLQAFAEMSSDWFWEQGPDLRYTRDSLIPLTSRPGDVGGTRR